MLSRGGGGGDEDEEGDPTPLAAAYAAVIDAEADEAELAASVARVENDLLVGGGAGFGFAAPAASAPFVARIEHDVLVGGAHLARRAVDAHCGGWTALHFAADRQDARGTQTVELLLEAGARTDVANEAGETPLHLAVDSGNAASVLALLSRGARPGAADFRGLTALHIAAKRGNDLVLSWLLRLRSAGASPNALTRDARSALHFAVAGAAGAERTAGPLRCVRLLLAAGANPDVQNRVGRDAPAHLAARAGAEATLMALLASGCDAMRENADRNTPIEVAARYGHHGLARRARRAWRGAYIVLGALVDPHPPGGDPPRAALREGLDGEATAASRYLVAMCALPDELRREIVMML